MIFKQVSLFSVRSLLFEMLEKNHSNYDWILCPNMSNSIVLLLTLALKNKELHFWQAIVKKDEEYIGFTSRPLKAIAWDNMFYLDIALVLEERYKVWTPQEKHIKNINSAFQSSQLMEIYAKALKKSNDICRVQRAHKKNNYLYRSNTFSVNLM